MLIQDLNYLETTSNEIQGASGATSVGAAGGLAFGDDIAISKNLVATYAESAPNFNLAYGDALSYSKAV